MPLTQHRLSLQLALLQDAQDYQHHLMNFTNEVGHQFDFLYPISDNFIVNLNLSTARRIHGSKATVNQYTLNYDVAGLDFNMDSGDMDSGLDMAIHQINSNWSGGNQAETVTLSYDDSPSLIDVIAMDRDDALFSYWPYRQIYLGISGYLFDDSRWLRKRPQECEATTCP